MTGKEPPSVKPRGRALPQGSWTNATITVVGMAGIAASVPSIYQLTQLALLSGASGIVAVVRDPDTVYRLQDLLLIAPLFLVGITGGASFATLAARRSSWWIPPVGLTLTLLITTIARSMLEAALADLVIPTS